MKTNSILFIAILVLFCTSCNIRINKKKSDKQVICAPSTNEVLRESVQNKAHQEGFAQGQDYGYREGFRAGRAKGKAAGLEEGRQKGVLEGQVLAYAYLKKFANPPDFSKGSPEHRVFAQMMERVIAGQFYEKGLQDAMTSPRFQQLLQNQYKAGLDSCFQQTYRANLRLGQQINLKYNPADRPMIDYEYVVKELKEAKGKYAYADPATFSKVLYHVHKEILGYIARLLEENENLIDDKIGNRLKRSEVFAEYRRLHSALAAKYYQQYLRGCKALNIFYQKSFYNHAIYFSIDVFASIVNSGLCALVDTILTYVKSNTQYAAIAGFEVLGNICEFLIATIMIEVEDKFKKRALVHDFKANQPYMVKTIAESLKGVTVGQRTFSKVVPSAIIYQNNDKDYSLTINATMQINAVATLGVDIANIYLMVDEASQSIIIRIPDAARVLEVGLQSYQIIKGNIQNTFGHKTAIRQYKYDKRAKSRGDAQRPATEFTTIIEKRVGDVEVHKLNALFQKNKFTLSELKAQKTSLNDDAGLQKVKNILKKVIEPMIILPSSCYTVYFEFKGQRQKIHEVSCR